MDLRCFPKQLDRAVQRSFVTRVWCCQPLLGVVALQRCRKFVVACSVDCCCCCCCCWGWCLTHSGRTKLWVPAMRATAVVSSSNLYNMFQTVFLWRRICTGFGWKCSYEEISSKTNEKNTNIRIRVHTRLPFGEWGVSRGVTQGGMPQAKTHQSPSGGSMRVIPHIRKICIWISVIAWYHVKKCTFCCHKSRRQFFLGLSNIVIVTICGKFHDSRTCHVSFVTFRNIFFLGTIAKSKLLVKCGSVWNLCVAASKEWSKRYSKTDVCVCVGDTKAAIQQKGNQMLVKARCLDVFTSPRFTMK